MPFARRAATLLALWFFAVVSIAADLPQADPESVGLSSERLANIKKVFDAKVQAGDFPGYVALVARKGKVVYHEAYGVQNLATKTPMAKDSIFRVYSMTKPIVSVAAMVLVEEGKMKLSDPVSMYLPELKDLTVIEKPAEAQEVSKVKTHPAKHPIRVLDLLIHTSGFSYAFFKTFPGGGALEQMYIDNKVGEFDVTNEEFVTLISKMPLRYDPGTTWWYSHSTDVLGRLIEVVSGMTLGQFIEQRVAKPLGMNDTAFTVAPDKVGRFAEPFDADKEGLILQYTDPTKPIKWEAGGHGLTATVMDYARFASMLLKGLARRPARAGQEDGGTDDHGPRRRDLRPRPRLSSGPGSWLWLAGCGAHRRPARTRGAEPHGRLGWRVLLGRLRRDFLLGRPERGTCRRVHDAVGAAARACVDFVQDAGGAGGSRMKFRGQGSPWPLT